MVRDYFAAWIEALASALVRTGRKPKEARALAEEVVGEYRGRWCWRARWTVPMCLRRH
jgi:hypothetical protein